MRVKQVEAIVLRHSDWGEADRLIGIFTLELGKLRAIAKGVRKPQSRKAGHLEPFTQARLLLAHGRDIPIITQAEAVEVFTTLREDMLLTTYASYVVELLDRFTYEEGENRRLYDLLKDTLYRLSRGARSELILRYYEMRLLDLVGFRPQLINCVNCGSPIQAEDQYFSAERGGVVCPACSRQTPGVSPVSMLALKYLRHFQRSGFETAAKASPPKIVYSEMESLMQHYLTYLLERGLNTPAFIRTVRKMNEEGSRE